MQLLNCVIGEPEAVGVERVFYNNNPIQLNVKDYLVEHSLIHLSSCNYNGVDPCGEGMIYSTWPNFVDSSGQIGLVPWPFFPGLNKGSSLVADTFNLTKDFDGIDRVFCDTVDIGAYEIHANCFSSTNEVPFAFKLPNIKILQNPVQFGEAIRAEIFTVTNSSLNIQLYDATGRLQWSSSKTMRAGLPEIIEIPIVSYCSGMYFLVVSDEQGHQKTEKVIIQ